MHILTDNEFSRLVEACRTLFGVTIPDEKRPIAEGRLRQLAARLGGALTPSSLVKDLLQGENISIVSDVVDALTTNHTYFGREAAHFELFERKILPNLCKEMSEGSRDIRVWCAAAATGEEPFYLAMLLKYYLGRDYGAWKAGVLATDLSQRALDVGRAGIYDAERIVPLRREFKSRYLVGRSDGKFEVRGDVRREVTFRRFNLMTEHYPVRRPFHVVFCRNVMIYFERDEVDHVLEQMARVMVPGGWFFTGLAESLGRNDPRFEYISPGVYRRYK